MLVLVAALLVFGPSKLPELGRTLGQGIREFKKATQSITEEVTKVASDEFTAASRPDPVSPQAPVGTLGEPSPKA